VALFAVKKFKVLRIEKTPIKIDVLDLNIFLYYLVSLIPYSSLKAYEFFIEFGCVGKKHI